MNSQKSFSVGAVVVALSALFALLPSTASAVKCTPNLGEPNWISYDQIFIGTITGVNPFKIENSNQPLSPESTPASTLSVRMEIVYKGVFLKELEVYSLPSNTLMKWKVGERYLFTTNTLHNHQTVLHCSDSQVAENAKQWIKKLQDGLAKLFEAPPPCKSSSECRIVTYHVPPAGDRPGKTLIRCQTRETPLLSGQSIQEYQKHITKGCVCENGLCLYKQ